MVVKSADWLYPILETLDDGIHIINLDGKTIFYNKKAAELDGLSQRDVLGVHVLDAFPSLTTKTSTLMNVIQTGKEIEDQQQTFKNRAGKKITTINKTLPIKLDQKIVGAIELSRDITHVKAMSELVLKLQEQVNRPKHKKTQETQAFYRFEDIITNDPILLRELERAKQVAKSTAPVLVIGETGTGKELVVQAIHQFSTRKQAGFIVQNCAAIPATLLEGVLFGTAKGAFTGAEDRPGLFELADGGTLFLDEIHAMPIDLQAKLLRVLEDGSIRRVGSTQTRSVNVRVLVATNQDPLTSIREGALREDLYYRIHVVGIYLPPLRKRKQDLMPLCIHFIEKVKRKTSSHVTHMTKEVLNIFASYHWPGNVRELENAIEGAMLIADGDAIALKDLPSYMLNISPHQIEKRSLRDALLDYELKMITEAMEATRGNVKQAAEYLGIPRQTLQYKLKKK
ncbi:sigma 54-interacting transcriptional regulator [Hazenella sp. IB182353]|nr:sigma 54-interacting transcriptional regulator [Polycladospora coralii]MBS7530558.1 sigma 54-interacting transcriptional regulator [Polycladospora coralii]